MDWTTLATPVLQALSGVLATILTGVAVWAIKKYTGIELDKNQQAQAKQIVMGVEDKALALIKKKCITTPGDVKHADAVEQLQTVTGLSQPAATSQVDRAVGSLPNVGALKTFDPCTITG